MKKNYFAQLFTFLLLLPVMVWGQQAGSLDRSFNYGMGADYQFNYGNGANSQVNCSVVQPDGKIVIGGTFDSYNGTTRNRIARLNANGSLDATFNPGTGANFAVRTTAVQADGKIIIGGAFSSYNGTTRNRIARLNANGSLDTTFNPGTGVEGANYSVVHAITVQADGKIIIGGDFNSYNGIARNRIARLNNDGSLDATFNPGQGVSNSVQTIATQVDGKVIIGGDFYFFNNISRIRIARLNIDGSLDTTFNPGTGANNTVATTALQPDGKLIIGGNFASFNGTAIKCIARLNANGSLDTTFNVGTGANNYNSINTTVVQTDGKIIVGGGFTSFNGISKGRIARLNANGSLDTTFNHGTEASDRVRSIAQQADGTIIIGGDFNSYNGTTRNYIARLNVDGSLETSFNLETGANLSVQTSKLQADGKIIIGGGFTSFNGIIRNRIARLNADGSLDTSFNPGRGAFIEVYATALQADGKIIIGGNFTTYIATASNYFARLNSDGSLDGTFNTGTGANGFVQALAVQTDGKIIIGGEFTSINGTTSNGIARLNADGSLDATFNPGGISNGSVRAIVLQQDGKIIIGGFFNTVQGTSRNNIARLNIDGSLDTSFIVGTGFGGISASPVVYSINIQPNGKIIIGGSFTAYNGIVRRQIARLNENGSLDQTFSPGTGGEESSGATIAVYTLLLQPDSKIIIGGVFTSFNGISRRRIARLNTDGSVDESFNPGTGFEGRSTVSVRTILLQPDSKIIIGGQFDGYNNFSTPNIVRIHLSDGGCT